jgi:hypothetical protein
MATEIKEITTTIVNTTANLFKSSHNQYRYGKLNITLLEERSVLFAEQAVL